MGKKRKASALKGSAPPANLSERSYNTEQEDHCETPLEAFKDLEPLLYYVAKSLKKDKSRLKIYDPFYCEGSMVDHLHELGFKDVYNKKEDFYSVVKHGDVPPYDVLVTNPPFSGNHMEKLLHFCLNDKEKRPFLLLLPNFVCQKQYFTQRFGSMEKKAPMFYMVPHKEYRFWAPGRQKEGIKGRYVEPKAHGKKFQCFWYCCLWESSEITQKWLKKKASYPHKGQGDQTCTIAKDVSELPGQFKSKKRLNPRQRAKIRKLQQAKMAGK